MIIYWPFLDVRHYHLVVMPEGGKQQSNKHKEFSFILVQLVCHIHENDI